MSESTVQSSFIFIAFIIYIPLLLLVSKISVPIASIVDKFKPINIYFWRSIQGIVFTFFASCLAVLSIYIFNETTIKDALFNFLIFVVLALAVAFASGGKDEHKKRVN